MGLLERLANAVGQKLAILHEVHGFRMVVDNTRPDIATADVVQRLEIG